MSTPSSQPGAHGPIGIVATLHEEINELLTWLSDVQCIHIGSRDSWTDRLDDHAVVVVLSYVGKVMAVSTTAVLITQSDVRAAVLAGVVDALVPDAIVGDVVVSKELLQRDVDALPLSPRWEISPTGIARFPTDAALASELLESIGTMLADSRALLGPDIIQAFGIVAPQVHRGLIVNGDHFVYTSAESAVLHTALPDALAVEMRDIAVARMHYEWGIPFVVIRTISDRTDDAASVDFVQFTAQVDSCYVVAILRRWLSTAVGA